MLGLESHGVRWLCLAFRDGRVLAACSFSGPCSALEVLSPGARSFAALRPVERSWRLGGGARRHSEDPLLSDLRVSTSEMVIWGSDEIRSERLLAAKWQLDIQSAGPLRGCCRCDGLESWAPNRPRS